MLAAAIELAIGLSGHASALENSAKRLLNAPLPPARPADLPACSAPPPQPVPLAIPAPAIAQATATLPAATQLMAPAVTIDHPYMLPVASRARMHDCALQWQKMKLSGAAADKSWRDFAQVCLVK